MTPPELVALVASDLGAIVRGRAVLASELEEHLAAGVGWVPANLALMPHGPLAEPNPFGSTGDLRLLPDPATHVRVGAAEPDESPLELLLCDIVGTDGSPWACCPRTFLRRTLEELERVAGATVLAAFEHEFQLRRRGPAPPPFSLAAMRQAEPFAGDVMGALIEAGVEPERFFAEFASHQFEIPVAPAPALRAADRAVVLREVVRESARRRGMQATFTPLLDPAEAGNGVHVHLSLLGEDGAPLLHDAARPGELSALAGSFAAGVLAHAAGLVALCAPSPVSAERLRPHHWSAGAAALGPGNREALLRVPPIVELGGGERAAQLRLEFRAADASANPYLVLGAIVRAGLDGIAGELPTPPLLEADPSSLDRGQSERFGYGALPATAEEALAALEADHVLRRGLGEELYEAHASLRRAELAAAADLDLEQRCARYADVY